ncbi:MAG: aldo/keto reductase [Candidatus Zophobacter franzmannii]|nr:aldo/keto reductase [Candidatus Zophobacter franzmannii]
MQYRVMPKSDDELSVLGFGCMRFLLTKDNEIDEPEAMKMMQHALDNGINYFDTAWPYHGEQSEPLVGRFLSNGNRAKVKLATKLPSWLIRSQQLGRVVIRNATVLSCGEKIISQQLGRVVLRNATVPSCGEKIVSQQLRRVVLRTATVPSCGVGII